MNKECLQGFYDRERFGILSSVYVGLILFVHPLILHDGFFDITETKQLAFVALSLMYLLLAGMCWIRSGRSFAQLSREDKYFLSLVLLYLLACVLSGEFRSSWIAGDNRYQGLLSYLLYFIVFFLISRANVSARIWYAVDTAFALVMILAIANHWKLDPLGTMKNLIPFDRGRYVSTIGNINFFGAYVCLILPILWGRWCCAEKKTTGYVLLALVLLGTFGAAASKSEGTILGLGIAMMVMPLLMKRSHESLRRWPLLPVITFAGWQLFSLLTALAEGDEFSELMDLLMHPVVCAVVLAAGLGAWLWGRGKSSDQLLRVRKGYGWFLFISFTGVVLLLILMNTAFRNSDFGILSRFLVLDSDWGTDRGKVWNACFDRWMAMPLWQKVLGGGSGCLARMDKLSPVFKNAILDAAHNEPLHMLLTNGIAGAMLYAVLNVSLIRRSIVQGAPETLVLCAGVIGYLAQSLVNIAQPMTTPLYYIFLAMLAGKLYGKEITAKTADSNRKILRFH